MGTANTVSILVLTLMCVFTRRRTRRSSGGTSKLHIKRRFSTEGHIDSSGEGVDEVYRGESPLSILAPPYAAQLPIAAFRYCINNGIFLLTNAAFAPCATPNSQETVSMRATFLRGLAHPFLPACIFRISDLWE